MPTRGTVVLDDRVLIEELIVGLRTDSVELATTASWYYRASRAAVLGAGGHLSGPFGQLDDDDQERAITSLLQLRDDIAVPDLRRTVPEMVAVARRHPRLNLLNLEAVATGRLLRATMWLSEETTRGILPAVLDTESVAWETITIP